ncbi:MAG: hypothetical protein ABNH38_03950 [Tateyamaria sp.]|jgi:hypothetical protein|uniref:hypothetical protein n=1 Tax=unclassified Tateyamaria TaxID=2645127 RepID=UPI000D55FEDB|nr:hypothetical protein [Tateyamaria sp. Alg231-49]
MKTYFLAGAVAALLSGCEVLILAPIALVAAPIILPIDAAQTSASITQPVEVLNRSGKILAGPAQAGAPVKARFQTASRTVRCSGKKSGALKGANQAVVKLTCTNGMRGEGVVRSNLTVGYGFKTELTGRRPGNIACSGNFRANGETLGPFLASCQLFEERFTDFTNTKKELVAVADLQAAVSAGSTASGDYAITLWVQVQ